ncbi:unnamed protein product, partial [Eruca vesicaria subsp. sativa]|nr:unnamed protein product [Eruca vesicaria subsp. sativa]
MDYTAGRNRLCWRQQNEAEFFFHLIRNQRPPSSRETGLLIFALLYLSICYIEHNYIFFSCTLRDHEEFKVFYGNKGLNDVENYELPRL